LPVSSSGGAIYFLDGECVGVGKWVTVTAFVGEFVTVFVELVVIELVIPIGTSFFDRMLIIIGRLSSLVGSLLNLNNE
jgi:hypothetical protein